jgi:catechol 2,3-dioxygenase-like lactoylglutathione lyase family enzyme
MPPLPLSALNHVSVVVSSIGDSVDFFVRVLGFQRVQRPRSFEFEGAW